MSKYTIKPKLRIKEIAKEKGTTLKYISEVLGVDPAAISQSISGNPTIMRLQEIADILEVPVTDLFEKPSGDGITCPNCGASLSIDVRITGEGRIPDHDNIRGAEYYK